MPAPVTLSLDWLQDLSFRNSPGHPAIELHSSTAGVASPPQALAYAVMACMGMDVVHVIRKTRCVFTAMTVQFEGERAAEAPKRFVTMRLHFVITGDPAEAVVARAIELSRTKYCSVWHTIRPDVELSTSFEIRP
jgi:putative redox protein